MTNFRKHALLVVLFENAPSILFLTLLRWDSDLRIAGWSSAVSAAIICTGYLLRWLRPHTILLGINLYMLLAAPSIELLFLVGASTVASFIVANSHSFVLVAIFLTGAVLTAVTKRGFVGASGNDRRNIVRYSLVLLAVSFLSVVWTFLVGAGRFLEIGTPLLLLFSVRRFLVARLTDGEDR